MLLMCHRISLEFVKDSFLILIWVSITIFIQTYVADCVQVHNVIIAVIAYPLIFTSIFPF